jgi:phospholipid transport system substrate-binding protein
MNKILTCNLVRLILGSFVLIPLLLVAQVQATEAAKVTDPSTLMKVAIEDVLAQLKTHEALYQTDQPQLRTLVAKSALPNLYIKRMAQLALAKHWRGANAQQRETYVSEFQRYLIRTYTTTMYLYRNTQLEMLSSKLKDDNKATLKVRVKNEKGDPVILFLRLETLSGAWKIIDINVEGISLVITARGVFDEEINRIGLDGFIENLKSQNDKAAQN